MTLEEDNPSTTDANKTSGTSPTGDTQTESNDPENNTYPDFETFELTEEFDAFQASENPQSTEPDGDGWGQEVPAPSVKSNGHEKDSTHPQLLVLTPSPAKITELSASTAS